ncbi:hypothetical protein ACFL3G_06855 [Planctomycetota bacterium]
MLFYLVFAYIAIAPGQAEFEANDVNISVNIRSNVYTYKLTNHNSSPVVSFETAQHVSYNFMVPDGWQMDISPKTFHAWTNDPLKGIKPNRTKEFSLRVSSSGAVLGLAPAKLKLRSGETIILPNIWVPVPEPRAYITLVAGVILFIVLLHSCLIIRKKRRLKKTAANSV